MKRHELTDEQWELIEPILPKRTATTGRKPRDPRQMLNGILWILRTGAPWRDLPERFGPWQSVRANRYQRGFPELLPPLPSETRHKRSVANSVAMDKPWACKELQKFATLVSRQLPRSLI